MSAQPESFKIDAEICFPGSQLAGEPGRGGISRESNSPLFSSFYPPNSEVLKFRSWDGPEGLEELSHFVAKPFSKAFGFSAFFCVLFAFSRRDLLD